jgi:hypothetical protein
MSSAEHMWLIVIPVLGTSRGFMKDPTYSSRDVVAFEVRVTETILLAPVFISLFMLSSACVGVHPLEVAMVQYYGWGVCMA